jgi:hypothetical protein
MAVSTLKAEHIGNCLKSSPPPLFTLFWIQLLRERKKDPEEKIEVNKPALVT